MVCSAGSYNYLHRVQSDNPLCVIKSTIMHINIFSVTLIKTLIYGSKNTNSLFIELDNICITKIRAKLLYFKIGTVAIF